MSTPLTEILEEVWDDGNCTGLDGWIGPGRGSAEVDSDALYRRDRMLRKAEEELAGAVREAVAKELRRAYTYSVIELNRHPSDSDWLRDLADKYLTTT